MKIEKFNESRRNKNTQYKMYVFVNSDRFGSPTAMNNTHDTLKDALEELKMIAHNGLPGSDGNTYHIYDAYIEKISRVKNDEIDAILKANKFNL